MKLNRKHLAAAVVALILVPVAAQTLDVMEEHLAVFCGYLILAFFVWVAGSILYSAGRVFMYSTYTRGPILLLRLKLVGNCLLSYAFLLYGFAILYVLVSRANPAAFNISRIDTFTAFYFSVITAATIGYGDIVPQSVGARLTVILEVFITLLYGLLVFSLLAGVLTRPTRNRQ